MLVRKSPGEAHPPAQQKSHRWRGKIYLWLYSHTTSVYFWSEKEEIFYSSLFSQIQGLKSYPQHTGNLLKLVAF